MLRGWITAVRQAVLLLRQIEPEDVSKGNLEDVLELGHYLNEVEREVARVLGPIKERLRKETSDRTDPYHIEKGGVKCVIAPQSPNVELRKDVDIAELKRKLGPRFHEYFEVVYKPRKDFRTRVAASANPDDIEMVLNAVAVNPRTPRVQFKGSGSSSGDRE